MQTVSGLFWGALSVLLLLIIAVFLIRVVRRYGGPVAPVADKVEELAGLSA